MVYLKVTVVDPNTHFVICFCSQKKVLEGCYMYRRNFEKKSSSGKIKEERWNLQAWPFHSLLLSVISVLTTLTHTTGLGWKK